MSAVWLVNGQSADRLSLADRAFQFGDGVFRTLRLQDGAIPYWGRHLARLAADAAALGISAPAEQTWLADIRQLGLRNATLKLVLTRGETPRGYAWPTGLAANRIVQAHPAIAATPEPTAGIDLCLCQTRASWQPRLAGIKHLNRLENVLARAEVQQAGCFEGLLLDRDDHVIEGSMSNVLLWQNGELHTPLLDASGVAGVTREVVMQAASAMGYLACQRPITLPELLAAEQVWVCNSLIGLRAVARLGEQHWSAHAIDASLRAAIADCLRKELFLV